jgi:hypothetical protein
MDRDKPIKISLTSTNSHTVKIPAGQGSFSIGIVGMDKKKFDVLVEENLPINWNVFNDFYTPHGKQNAEKYPYGDWPRFFYYFGNDIGLYLVHYPNHVLLTKYKEYNLLLDKQPYIGYYALHISTTFILLVRANEVSGVFILGSTECKQTTPMGYIPASTKGEAFRYGTKQTLNSPRCLLFGSEVRFIHR